MQRFEHFHSEDTFTVTAENPKEVCFAEYWTPLCLLYASSLSQEQQKGGNEHFAFKRKYRSTSEG